jgi:HD-GYP domain-containing protein (c-di-GMP phosphodiesterase class II)
MLLEGLGKKSVHSAVGSPTSSSLTGRSGVMLPAERMVGVARARRARQMPRREALVRGTSAVAFLVVATALAVTLPSERTPDLLLVGALVAGYALVSRVRFEFGDTYVVPEQLVFVAMLAVAPLPLVPVMVAAGAVLALVPDFARGTWHWDRTITTVGDCWFSVGPVLVLAALAPGPASLAAAEIYVLAYLAQVGGDLAWTLLRDRLIDRVPLGELLRYFAGCAQVDAILSPIAFLVAVSATETPVALLAFAPLVWLLEIFSRDRRERYAAALELNRAYRGTVMLLSDVLEFEDQYTAQHSRSVVDLVVAVADELGVERDGRQELEFAAMLHDVGKISIPKEILRKSCTLTEAEHEVVRNHTIEGQFILDRVGGLLGRVGEVVRSCHERWDGRGYPDGLEGDEIPLASRIVFACDAYNAMTTDRPYRPALTTDVALQELSDNAGTQFDPRVAAALINVVEEGRARLATTDHVRAVLVTSKLPQSAASTP